MKQIKTQYKLQSEKHAFLKLFMDDSTIDIFMDEVRKEGEYLKLLQKKRKKLKKV